jgi:hypothetical protein
MNEKGMKRMTKCIHKGRQNAVKVVAHRAKAGRSACMMRPEYLAEIERSRLSPWGDVARQ